MRQYDYGTAVEILRQRFGESLQTGSSLRTQHAHTLTFLPGQPPDAVLFAASQDQVVEAVQICAAHHLPIIPFGAGTSLEGHVNAPHGGLSLDLSRMTAIKTVNAHDLDCVVEPGVTRKQLNTHVRDTGLFFAVDPGAEDATLGGMASTRASGTNAVRYGTMRETVLNLTAVLADGSVVKTAGRARKSAAGYDLTRLMVGAEGTLGVITELTLRLYGIPECILAAVCPFETLEGACNTVIQSIALGLGLARMELLDEVQIATINHHSKTTFEERPTLFLEFHGSEVGTRDQVEHFRSLAEAEGAIRFDWAAQEEDRNRLWKARHDVYWAVRGMYPGKDILATDVCVPISRLADCVLQTKADITSMGLFAPIVGHAGDGNFHTTPVFDKSDPTQMAKIEHFLERLAARAIAMEGTCTGEHGIGQGKAKYLRAEIGDTGLAMMRSIKHALDPHNIMNPGKLGSAS